MAQERSVVFIYREIKMQVPFLLNGLNHLKILAQVQVTINNTGGTDHLAFDAVGIPGFQFIQDQIEYNTRTHHTNMDTYDHLVPDDLKQAATIVAAFVYNTAQRDQKIPRKAMPQAQRTGHFNNSLISNLRSEKYFFSLFNFNSIKKGYY